MQAGLHLCCSQATKSVRGGGGGGGGIRSEAHTEALPADCPMVRIVLLLFSD